MSILQVKDLYMGFLDETLFRNVSFSVDERDKIGIIGINGSGKSTLIKILLGLENNEIDPNTKERGSISKSSNLKIGYLSQNPVFNKSNTVFEELMDVFQEVKEDYHRIQILTQILSVESEDFDKNMQELGEVTSRYESNQGYSLEYKIKQVLNGLGVYDYLWNNKIQNLSGGQLSRIALGKILLEEPDLLILDEPTNHLDLNAIEWLEKYLKEYNKAVILVSHDVYFLDNVVNRIFEIEQKKLNIYTGNYTDFVIQKEAYISGAVKSYTKEQEKVKKMEEFIRRYKAGVKSKQARGREKILNRMEKMENPVFVPRKMKLKFKPKIQSGSNVLFLKNLSKSFGDKNLFQNLNLNLYRGDKVGIIGKNGVGKSTLLKMIMDSIENPIDGIKIGEKVKIAYYDQAHQGLNLKNTIVEELTYGYDLTYEKARTLAGGFLFSDEDADKVIGSLSGGEKARVVFMKMLLEEPNFIILDEPTNHLDIYSREILIEALEDYEGTILVVSHDRNFLDSIVTSIYEITEDGADLFDGDYNSYIQQRDTKVIPEKKVEKLSIYEENKKFNSMIRSIEKKIAKIETQINKEEENKKIIEDKLHKAGQENNVDSLISLQEKLDNIDNNIISLMEEWENANEELEEYKINK
ncbi:ABC-F family ATP-binding cassette domain-containing protein [Fusobacterium sp. PH5-44]|uniref:ABC-F family ATP-binding cassette domain-containing protein n=1 Tax=unclassified Fusobacterium TaxID=2648384 RepID=UPI003D2249C4